MASSWNVNPLEFEAALSVSDMLSVSEADASTSEPSLAAASSQIPPCNSNPADVVARNSAVSVSVDLFRSRFVASGSVQGELVLLVAGECALGEVHVTLVGYEGTVL